MRVILEPKVHLLSSQVFHAHPAYGIPEDGSDAVKIGAFAAKGCYDSFLPLGRPNETNQREVKEHRHGSVFEHVVFGLFVEGVTRGLTLEMNRHRQLAVSQRSTRYTREEDAAVVLEPYYAALWRKHDLEVLDADDTLTFDLRAVEPGSKEAAEVDLVTDHVSAVYAALRRYEEEVELLLGLNPENLTGFDLRKWARGKARNVLPHALETRVTYTGNVRAWRWFIESRSSIHAEPEIRRLARQVWDVLRDAAPLYFDDFEEGAERDGMRELVTPYSKV